MSQQVSKATDLDKDENDDRPKYYASIADNATRIMMGQQGFVRADSVSKADCILFTGGADILPLLYGEEKLPSTYVDFTRDMQDIGTLRAITKLDSRILLGICRGAQFLNVMVGNGSLWQDVNNHNKGSHQAIDTETGNVIQVSSTHHQMMIPGSSGKIILKAHEATRLRCIDWDWDLKPEEDANPECILYDNVNALCYQPHPEFDGANNRACRDYFFNKIEEYYLPNKQIKAMTAHREKIRKHTTKKVN